MFLEFLASNPAFVAMAGTIFFALVLKGVGMLVAADKQPRAIQQAPQDKSFECAVYEIRLTEQKMVEAGVIQKNEMTICDNESCQNCAQTRADIDKQKNSCPRCGHTFDYDGWCSDKCVAEHKKRVKSAVAMLDEAERKNARIRTVGSVKVRMPDVVPDHAYVGKEHYDPNTLTSFVIWKWTDTETGLTKFVRQAMPDPRMGDFY